jgi:hypothetical protein
VPLLIKDVNDVTRYIPTFELNELLGSGKIKTFMRSGGEWVDPKVGPIRGQGFKSDYTGPERRARWQ